MNENLMHFLIGSSVFITIYPMCYLYNLQQQLTEEEKLQVKIPIPLLIMLLPLTFGLLNVCIYQLLELIPRKLGDIYFRFCVGGAVSALILTIFLQFIIGNLHSNIYFFSTLVVVFYGAVYFSIGVWLRTQIIYGSTSAYNEALNSSRSSSSSDDFPDKHSFKGAYTPPGKLKSRRSMNSDSNSRRFDQLSRSLEL
jgi:hypothetical protein